MATKAAVVAGARELARRDPVMKRMLREHGVPELHRGRRQRTHFAELARMICYQQLAGRAASAIHGRFEALFEGPPTPEVVLALPMESLRGAGLSNAKATSIRDLAEKVEQGAVELDRVARLSDAKVVSELVLVRGIGEWTAHMFLMFQLGRLDVWPVLDFGVRNGFARMYGLKEMPTAKQLEPLGDPFHPYRSLVAWYCWHVADTVTPD
ncbi:MAG: DNA-3-methyladenine glycosylase [Actinomycetota bacterium]|jgi:3-methyladenine DNA glycosylase/8-oxoguanine DNA glycosylase|nr:DNA-3-methyladenine glycosylase [Actinomycetota bacterium]